MFSCWTRDQQPAYSQQCLCNYISQTIIQECFDKKKNHSLHGLQPATFYTVQYSPPTPASANLIKSEVTRVICYNK